MKQTTIDFDRLVKILGRLDSSHDGEVIAAARKAVNILKSGGLTFEDLKPEDNVTEKARARRQADDLFVQVLELKAHMHQVDSRMTEQQQELARLRAENDHLNKELDYHMTYADRIDARKRHWQEKAFDAVKLARELSGRIIELEEGLAHLEQPEAEHLV